MAVRCAVLFAVVVLGVFSRQGPDAANREAAYRANNVGVARLEQFDYDGAAKSFSEALTLHPTLDLARLNLAIALFYGGKTAEASSEIRTAAERLPNAPQAHYVQGLIARAEDNLELATAAFERVLKIDGADAGAKVNLGQIALQQRQFDRALPLFQGALFTEPYNVTAAYSIALALTRSGKAEEGRKAMQLFEALRDSAYGVTYSQAYLAQGQYAEAIASTGAEPELVDPATPDVTFSDATATMLPVNRAASGVPRGGITLFDADGDGDLDLLDVSRSNERFLRNERGVFSFDTARAGLPAPGDAAGLGAMAGDFDNDGRSDLFLLRPGGHRLVRQNPQGVFEEVTGFRATNVASAAAFADIDHDGDLDIFLPGKPTHLMRNNGNGTFADVAVQAGVSAPIQASAVVATDYDNRRDIDLILATSGAGTLLYRNLRDGSFRNVAGESGLPVEGSYTALAAGDLNKDGFTDFFLGRAAQPGQLALSDGKARFRTSAAPDESRGAIAAQFVDYDNDGLLDLLTIADKQARLFRNIGGGKWSDVSAGARVATLTAGSAAFQGLALGDLDGDGDTDAAVRLSDGDLRIWRNEGGNRHASLRVRLAARVSNRTGVGSKIEIRAGSLRQQLETSSATPAAAPADVVFGLGSRAAADVLRVLWPSGILQAETELKPEGSAPAPAKSIALTLTELDRKPSSCPYLFTWNGAAFEFVTDFMGGSEMGAWLAPGTWNAPDPDEYVRVTAGQLRPRNGRYELRVTNELEEALFVDRVQLVAVDHPRGAEAFPNEGLRSPPRPPLSIVAARGARPPVRAVDEHGHDVLAKIAALDRQYPDDFRLVPIRGYAESHSLTLTLEPEPRPATREQRLRPERGAGGKPAVGWPPSESERGWGPASTDNADSVVLLLTGWTDYAFSNDNVAASQLGTAMAPPSLQVKDAKGRWQTVVKETGFPVGRPQTVVVDLTGKWLSPSRDVRIVTNMRVYWDQILVAASDTLETRLTRLDPVVADLRWRGFSAEQTPDGREPYGYDYARVSMTAPWKVMAGRYTREGDVKPLLRAVDDMYVISRPGDELALAFDAGALPPLAAGWERTFLMYAHGWSKEMNPRSASPDTIGPLPFFRMSGYPYGPGEHYPRTELHREYRRKVQHQDCDAASAIDRYRASLRSLNCDTRSAGLHSALPSSG